jgi:periplasmic protein TonB
MNEHQVPQPSHVDRLTFTVFIAIALHAIIILGVSFGLPEASNDNAHKVFDVVLASKPSERPDKAKAIGMMDQAAGGDYEETQTSNPTQSVFTSSENNIAYQAPSELQKQENNSPKIITSSRNDNEAFSSVLQQKQKLDPSLESVAQQQTAEEIASLRADIEALKVAQSKSLKERYASAAVHRRVDAAYIGDWTKRIEYIGNLNYPEAAKSRKIYGDLLLSVGVKYDGTIHSINIKESSGHKVLDDAAIRIVRLSAPFAPFYHEMKKDTDIIHIVRLWKFQPDNTISAQ